MWIWFLEIVKFWRRSPSNDPGKESIQQVAHTEMHMERVDNDNVQVAPQDAQVTLMRMSDVGHGNVQVGHSTGGVKVFNVGSVVQNHAQHHSHVTIIHTQLPSAVGQPASGEQSAVLRKLDQLRDRVPILDFMEREFGTRMVIHLKTAQLFRLNRYLDVVLRDSRNAKAKRRGQRTS